MEDGPTAELDLTLQADWEGACRRMSSRIAEEIKAYPTTAERSVGISRGAGGDLTLVIDKMAEDVVFDELAQLADGGAKFTALSEERGEVSFGSTAVKVVVDPIDGSLNAQRVGNSWSLSVAVAAGETMQDVVFGYVHDFGSGEHWVARRGAGASVDGRTLDPAEPGNGLEIVGLESTRPERFTPELIAAFSGRIHRIRSIGSIALTLCQVAAARYDGMLSLRPCRSVDAAAAQLIAREAGATVRFGDDPDLRAPLVLEAYKPVAAARSADDATFLTDALA